MTEAIWQRGQDDSEGICEETPPHLCKMQKEISDISEDKDSGYVQVRIRLSRPSSFNPSLSACHVH